MKKPTKTVYVSVPVEIHDKLKRLAEKDKRSLSNYIELLIENVEE